jgi:hypothetical protein
MRVENFEQFRPRHPSVAVAFAYTCILWHTVFTECILATPTTIFVFSPLIAKVVFYAIISSATYSTFILDVNGIKLALLLLHCVARMDNENEFYSHLISIWGKK